MSMMLGSLRAGGRVCGDFFFSFFLMGRRRIIFTVTNILI